MEMMIENPNPGLKPTSISPAASGWTIEIERAWF